METTITTRSRNLGYGWSNQPVRVRTGLGICQPDTPNVRGGVTTCEREMTRARRLNSSNDWRDRLFVGTRPITHVRRDGQWWPVDYLYSAARLLHELRRDGALVVRLAEES